MAAWSANSFPYSFATICVTALFCASVQSQTSSLAEEYPRGRMQTSGIGASVRAPIRVAQLDSAPYGFTSPAPDFNQQPQFDSQQPLTQATPFDGNWSTPYGAPPSPAYQPGVPLTDTYQPPYKPGGFQPNAFPGIAYPAPLGRASPLGSASLFGREPSAPFSQDTLNADPIDYDLVIGATPSSQTMHYWAGVGFNSDLGLFGQFIYDERDFDWRAPPWINSRSPFRGGGQRLRIEAMPGDVAQRYLVSFTEPYLSQFGGRPVSLNLSAFYFDRNYFHWDERRFGGRIGLGYEISRTLSLNAKFRIENVDISKPRLVVPELARSLGDSELYGAGINLVNDNLDSPFAPTEGTYLGLGAEYVFGNFEYPRGTVNYKRYSWFRQRADGSGRHVLGLHFDGGITGNETPIYENFFAGGFSTLRGFRYRHASPKDSGVIVGGELSLLGTAEYLFPITADDMVRGVLFCDLGTVEESTSLHGDNLRVALGGGLRIRVPALGPAPLSIDFTVPVSRADTDRVQNIAFFVNVGR